MMSIEKCQQQQKVMANGPYDSPEQLQLRNPRLLTPAPGESKHKSAGYDDACIFNLTNCTHWGTRFFKNFINIRM